MKTDLFQSCGHCWVFQICWHIEYNTFTSWKRLGQSSASVLAVLPDFRDLQSAGPNTVGLHVSHFCYVSVNSQSFSPTRGVSVKNREQKWPPTDKSGFPGGSAGKESTCNARNLSLVPEFGRSPGEGKGYPLQYSGLGNSMDYTVPWGCKESVTTEWLWLFFIDSAV